MSIVNLLLVTASLGESDTRYSYPVPVYYGKKVTKSESNQRCAVDA